jgi:hypothetical protein
LFDLIGGAAPASTLLLYPWEIVAYSAARRHLISQARNLGLDNWPTLPELPEVQAWQPQGVTEFAPHARTFDWNAHDEDEVGESGLPALAGANQKGPTVVITTAKGAYQLPADRIVVVIRAKAYFEMDASSARAGDTLVVARGTHDPSASKVVERMCRRNPVMNQTRAMSEMWRDNLKQFVAQNFPGKTVAEAYRGMHPAVTVTYPEFLHWLRDGEPITPTRPNIIRLMNVMGYDEDLAILVYEEGLHHKKDRRKILEYALDLANSRLDDIYEKSLTPDAVGGSLSLTVEDLTAVIGFEMVTGVEVNHASG